jgi:hypothetical protein
MITLFSLPRDPRYYLDTYTIMNYSVPLGDLNWDLNLNQLKFRFICYDCYDI